MRRTGFVLLFCFILSVSAGAQSEWPTKTWQSTTPAAVGLDPKALADFEADIEEYAARYLFAPLGIERYYWKRTPFGLADTEGGLYLNARDLAKIGYLFLKNGEWEGKQIVQPGWVELSVTPSASVSPTVKYGLKWWLFPYNDGSSGFAWAGSGFGGQKPIVLPEYNMVLVFTAWNILGGQALSHRVAIDRAIAAVVKPKHKTQ